VAIELRMIPWDIGLGLELGLGLADFRISGLEFVFGLRERGLKLGLATMGLEYNYGLLS